MFIHMHTFLQTAYLKWSNDVIITPRRSQQQEIGDNSEIGEVLRGSFDTRLEMVALTRPSPQRRVSVSIGDR